MGNPNEGGLLWPCTLIYESPGNRLADYVSRDNRLKFTGETGSNDGITYIKVVPLKEGSISYWVKKGQ
ncbi:MAG: hypothetical protein AAB486_03295 [Patescibacteria group bacterium]